MNKAEVVARVKEAADYYREGRYYEAYALIHPIAGRVNHEKIKRLHETSRRQVLGNLGQLLEEKRFRRMLELGNQFLKELDDPDVQILLDEAQKQAAEPAEAPLEISLDDIDPAMDDPVTEIMSDSWVQAVTDEDTMSDEREADAGPFDTEPVPESLSMEPDIEESVSEAESESELDINTLIQRGVSLYEVGDVENALKTWEHGLHLEPDNVILKEYIVNAKRELHPEDAATDEQSGADASQQPAEKEPLDKEELNSIIAIGRAGEVDRAHSLLMKLIDRTGDTRETDEARDFIANLKQDYGVSTAIAKAESMINANQPHQAVSLLEKQQSVFPGNEKLAEALEIARRKAAEQPGPGEGLIELDFGSKDPSDTGQRRVRSPEEVAERAKRKAAEPSRTTLSPRKWLGPVIVVASLLILAGVGYLLIPQLKLRSFYKQFKDQKQAVALPGMEPTPASEAAEIEKKQTELVSQAKQLYNQRRYLLSYYLFLHANTLKTLSDTDQQFLSAARSEMGEEVNEARTRRNAEQAFNQGRFDDAISGYYSLLSNSPDNIRYKKKLIESYEQAGVMHAYAGDGQTAQEYFSYAEILDPANPILKRHRQVMNRYISGLISKRQVREWFHFFR